MSVVAPAAPEVIVGPMKIVQDPYHSKTLVEPAASGVRQKMSHLYCGLLLLIARVLLRNEPNDTLLSAAEEVTCLI